MFAANLHEFLAALKLLPERGGKGACEDGPGDPIPARVVKKSAGGEGGGVMSGEKEDDPGSQPDLWWWQSGPGLVPVLSLCYYFSPFTIWCLFFFKYFMTRTFMM